MKKLHFILTLLIPFILNAHSGRTDSPPPKPKPVEKEEIKTQEAPKIVEDTVRFDSDGNKIDKSEKSGFEDERNPADIEKPKSPIQPSESTSSGWVTFFLITFIFFFLIGIMKRIRQANSKNP